MAERKDHALRAFIRDARARLTPADVGLHGGGRRRVKGLRRGEVAELAGISEAWYTRFETGHAILSVSALHRVADVLRMTRSERLELLDLARPDIAAATAGGVARAYIGLGTTVDGLRELARSCASASSIAELAAASTRAVAALCPDVGLGYMRAYDKDRQQLELVGATGAGADALMGHQQPCASVSYTMQHFHDGRGYGEPDLRTSPCPDLRTRIERVGVYAYHTQPIMGRNGLDVMLGVAMREPRPPEPFELSIVEAAAAIVELTLRR